MKPEAIPIVVPLGDQRELIVTATDDPDCVLVTLHGRNSGSLVLVPRAGNSVALHAEVHCQPIDLSQTRRS